MTNIEHQRHTLSHLLAAAVKELYPDAKPTLGPAIDNGFYYDFDDLDSPDLPALEKKMKELLPSWELFAHYDVSADEARSVFANNQYKKELIDDLETKGESITLYYSGPTPAPEKDSILAPSPQNLAPAFLDLCRGGHIDNPAKDIPADSFTLSHTAGAYWRGDENNTMLTRIYGLAFANKKELEEYISMQEEAKKRDHKVLGPQLKIFTLSPLVGSGLPLLQPNGMIIRGEIEEYLWELHKRQGYQRVWTPHLAKEALYETSGHAEKFGDELFRVQGKEDAFFLKPMNCPHHMQIFADNHFSYRDMPVRYFEPGTVYRDEKSGQLGGLTRVRAITQDDGHLFCRKEQIKDEVASIVRIIKEFYTTMGMMEGYWVSFSVRGDDRSNYLGTDDVWNIAEQALDEAAQENGLNHKRVEGEATFYGPKLDFMFKDAIGREWQLATIQVDFNLPERFDLSFINESGDKERPVVIHRAISGSLERFMGVMIEHFAGAFPTWLSPTQISVIPISDKHLDYANDIATQLRDADIRVELDDSNETLGKKIRSWKISKSPYAVVIGDKEVESNTLTIESRSGEKTTESVGGFVKHITEEIEKRAL